MDSEPINNENIMEDNNEATARLLQRMLNRNNQNTSNRITLDSIIKLILSTKFFVISLSISSLIIAVLLVLLKEKEFTWKDLENEETNIYLLGLFFLILVSVWNVFLFFFRILCNFDYSKINFSDEVN